MKTYRGEVIGVNRRCNYEFSANPRYEMRSCIEFDLGGIERLQMEIPGNHALGTKFVLTLELEGQGEIQ